MVVDASGTNLLLTAPATRLFTGSPVHDQFGELVPAGLREHKSWVEDGRDEGKLYVIDLTGVRVGVSSPSRVLISAPAGIDPGILTATSDPTKFAFTAQLSERTGFFTVDLEPVSGHAMVTRIPNQLDLRERVGPTPAYRKKTTGSADGRAEDDQRVQTDIRNAAGVVVTSDLRYAFVVDSSLPVGFSEEFIGYPSQATRFEDFHDLGSKVGVIKDPFCTRSGIRTAGCDHANRLGRRERDCDHL